jgi:Flp pilus assembly pilin Flp
MEFNRRRGRKVPVPRELLNSQVKLMHGRIHSLWSDEQGQDIAEYSVMLAVVLVIVVGTVRLIGSNAGNIFSQVGSSIQ